jgi:hypothetical protein
MARHIQVNRDWCPVIVPLAGPAQLLLPGDQKHSPNGYSTMRDLNYQLKMLCKHSHEGSFETRVGRERQLTAIANQLHELGFRQLKATSLKQKHVQALVNHWLGQICRRAPSKTA